MNKKNLAMVVILVFGLVVSYRWFINKTLTYGDWVFHFSNSMVEWKIPETWNTSHNLGQINLGTSTWPIFYLYGIFGDMGYNSDFPDKIIFMAPLVFLSALFSYLLFKRLSLSNKSSIIGSLVYTYNSYFLTLRDGHLTLLTSFSFAPIILSLFISYVDSRRTIYLVWTAILCLISGIYEFRALYIIVFILSLYTGYRAILSRSLGYASTLVKDTLLLYVALIMLNLYWILPFLKTEGFSTGVIFSRGLFGNSFMNVTRSLAFFHPFWTGGGSQPFAIQPIPIQFWLIPILSIVSLTINRKNNNVIFFGIVLCLGLLLTKQAGIPFQGLYLWLYNYFPGFNAFRESSKFYFLLAIGNAGLIAYLIEYITNSKLKYIKIAGYIIAVIVGLTFLWNTKASITGEVGTLVIAKNIPSDYLLVKDFVLSQNEYFRTLWVPNDSRWSIYSNNHPSVQLVRLINSSWSKFTRAGDLTSKFTEADKMIDVLSKDYSNRLLDVSSIKYVIVPIQDIANNDDFFIFYGKNRPYYVQKLNDLEFLKQIPLDTKEMVLYENTDYRPHIYLSPQPETISSNIVYEKVENNFISPIEYRVLVKDLSTPIYLNFSETYHSQWKIRIGNFNWFDSLYKKNYFIDDKYHFQNDAGLNSFLINPKELGTDGEKELNITLYFNPQSYLNLGLLLSLTTSAVVICSLVYLYLTRHANKNI